MDKHRKLLCASFVKKLIPICPIRELASTSVLQRKFEHNTGDYSSWKTVCYLCRCGILRTRDCRNRPDPLRTSNGAKFKVVENKGLRTSFESHIQSQNATSVTPTHISKCIVLIVVIVTDLAVTMGRQTAIRCQRLILLSLFGW